jgi:hypothetical protein
VSDALLLTAKVEKVSVDGAAPVSRPESGAVAADDDGGPGVSLDRLGAEPPAPR